MDETKPERKEAEKMESKGIRKYGVVGQSRYGMGDQSETPVATAAEKNQPEKKISTGGISATIWQNQGVSKTGQAAVYRTITLQRRYKDKADKWQSTNSLRVNDLPKAALVLNKAFEYLVLKEQGSNFNSQEAVEDDIEEEIVI
ncbi:MAG: hypothetical protein QS98_C0006G0016 [archaeon GW2011_AR3]|nr:MAG: hypothetical protein QS98_C0006G0016 [archaeon GW2011_AR3]MBS3109222.1 hypothetical protein [Candidatus Woesearchaeota archaeon]